jgi:hypothetical protein
MNFVDLTLDKRSSASLSASVIIIEEMFQQSI